MFYKNFAIHFRIINIWLGFVFFLIVVSNLPHQNVPIFSWINTAIYFLLMLQCVYLSKQAQHNRFIFLNISLFALSCCLSFFSVFIGQKFLFGNYNLAMSFYEYTFILLNFSFALCVVYICIKYLFRNLKPLQIYGVSFLIILPILIWHFYPFLLDANFILEHDLLFDKRLLFFNFLPLFFLVFYGILLYKYDKSLGEHINTIMVCFFIMNITDIPNQLGNVYHIMIFIITQSILLLSLSFFIITMFKLLNHAYSPFGQFYDSIISEEKNLGIPIKRKKSTALPILDFAKAYFHQKRNTFAFGALLLIFAMNYWTMPGFVKLNIATISLVILILFFYMTALYQKRSQKGDLLNVNHSVNN